ncbi:probable ATP-dependent RNA helicase DHX58 [Lingula anatina]|uniref:RNA helicase n=1 Tax=Lingula anatina TaxID=7574 RepID=A0A1S3IPM6_LINAN|nr:probable ATP-dependent RNA helicase DHX58 [Lingula anatina]|eukprot:XP_013399861.1 probable ATP-dependent RNA helicase DHX58 [Lingula anatina]
MAESKIRLKPYAKLRIRVCKELQTADFDFIKLALQDEIPAGELEEISNPQKLWNAMKKRNLIEPNDVGFLKEIMEHIDRLDLVKVIEEYEEDRARNPELQAPDKDARYPEQVESPGEETAKKEALPLHTASSDSQLQKSAKPSNRYHLLHSESSPGLSNANQPVIGSTGGQSPLLDVQGTTGSQPGTRNIGASPLSPLNGNTSLTFSNHVESKETFPKQRVGFDGKVVNSSDGVGNFERPQLPASLDSLSSQTARKPVYGDSEDLEEDSSCGASTAQAVFIGSEPVVEAAGEMTERNEGIIRQASVPLEHLVQDGVPTKKKFSLRKYQRELANEAIEGTNTIICAPTGSGKTLTAAYISRIRRSQVLKNGQKFKAVFIVCIRNLIQQQKDAFQTIFPPQDKIVGAISQTSDNLKTCLLNNDIVMLTAQILVNDIKEGDVKITDFDLMIMDECHHTDLDHPYNMIMRLYMTEKKNREQRGESTECLPQIIGLSASLGTGKGNNPLQHYYRVCANLDCFTISHVRNPVNEKELLCINPKPKTDQIKLVQPRSSDNPFILMVKQMMEASEKEVSFPMELSKKFDKGSQGYENWVIENRNEAERQALHTPEMRNTVITCRFLRDLNSALMLYDDLRGKDALEFLTKKILENDDRSIHSESPEVETKLKGRFMSQYRRLQSHCEAESPTSNKMLEELYRLLTEQFEKNPESRGIVLIRTREGCSALERCIQENVDQRLVRVGRMTGQSGDTSMTDVQQQKVIKAFKKGLAEPDGINLLVATDVAQEGLDIPKCNLMIRYNFVSNEIGSVQSKGRARAKESECYLIVPDGSINADREYKNMSKEHAMLEALKDFDKLDPEEVRRNIKEKQNELWGRHLQAQAQSSARQSELEGSGVKVLCKECKAFLCRGNFIIKKGGHYICVDLDFPKKIREEKIRRRDFRTDAQVGVSICRQTVTCGQSFGPVLEYKQGSRRKGYTLSKDKIMLLYPGKEEPVQVKKWPSVCFNIVEESVSD